MKEWCLINGTPASATDIGLNHIYQKKKPPVDVVISGPNVGRNSTALYMMSSGTVGAAMEGALLGKKSIALSYSYITRDVKPESLVSASEISIKLIKHLIQNWSADADLYAVNIPTKDGLSLANTKIFYAPVLENRWKTVYEPLPYEYGDIVDESTSREVQFKWNPDFDSVHHDVRESGIVSDGSVIENGNISVTPLKAVFKQVAPVTGEIDLSEPELPITPSDVVVSIKKEDYVYSILVDCLTKQLGNCKIHDNLQDPQTKTFHYGDYEDLDLDRMNDEGNYLACSYIYRKSLIRKHYLANTIRHYLAKNPDSILKKSFPESYHLELDYAEFLDDALLEEANGLDWVIKENEKLEFPKTFILKPSMADRGQGIRLFQTYDQLESIFVSFEEGEDEETVSQLRHFVIQDYVDRPLLIPEYNNRKFHIRCYVVCKGNLEVFVYRDMLMLFSSEVYRHPSTSREDSTGAPEMGGHLTNTCIQPKEYDSGTVNVVEFWKSYLNDKPAVFDKICEIVREMFKAAVSVDKFNFQPMDCAFETFGVDFIVDENLDVYLLEVNAYPDFKQTGEDLKGLIHGLFEGIVATCVCPFIGGRAKPCDNMVEVLRID